MCKGSFSFLLFFVYVQLFTQSAAEYSALNEYFADNNGTIPPKMGYTTYGGVTQMLLAVGDPLSLVCQATYKVKFVFENMSSWPEEAILKNISRSYLLKISNVSEKFDGTIIKCMPYDHENSSSTFTAVRIRLSYADQSGPTEEVYAIRYGYDSVTSYEGDKTSVLFSVQLRTTRGNFSFAVQWTSPDMHINDSKWSTINGSELIARLQFLPKYRYHYITANFTVSIIDLKSIDRKIIYSKTFRLIVLRDVYVSAFIYRPLNDTNFEFKNVEEFFKAMAPKNPLVLWNRTHYIVCAYRGNPILRENAKMAWRQRDCYSEYLLVSPNCTDTVIVNPGEDDPNGVSYLPDWVTPNRLITAMKVVANKSVIYQCIYEPLRSKVVEAPFTVSDVKDNTASSAGVSAHIVSPAADEITIGDNVTISCTVTRYSYDAFYWATEKDEAIFPGSIFPPGYATALTRTAYSFNFTLIIFNISMEQSGRYTCSAKPSEKDEPMVNVQVNVKVQISKNVYFGDRNDPSHLAPVAKNAPLFEVNCDARGVPKPKITWSKLGDLKKCGREFCDSDRISFKDDNKTLRISRVQLQDSGVYVCTAENKIGRNITNFTLEVLQYENGHKIWTLATGLGLSSTVTLIMAYLAYSFYRKRTRKAHLKVLYRNLKDQAVGEDASSYQTVVINENLPSNYQTEILPFDFRYEVPMKNIIFGEEINRGAFGKVIKGQLTFDDCSTMLDVVIKTTLGDLVLDRSNVNIVEQLKQLLSEMKLMMFMGRHVNVLRLLGVVTKNMSEGQLYAVLEFCKFGSLKDYLTQRRNIFQPIMNICINADLPIPRSTSPIANPTSHYVAPIDNSGETPLNEVDLLWFAYQIACGMEHLALKNIVHRDLALRNILLADHGIVKIADYGLALDGGNGADNLKRQNVPLPVKWMALESIMSKTFSKESDVWSYGIVLWELFTLGKTPYPEHNLEHCPRHNERILLGQFIRSLQSGQRMAAPERCPANLYELMLHCWSSDMSDRPTMAECENVIADTAKSCNVAIWEGMMRILHQISDQISSSSPYYNLTQKAWVDNVDTAGTVLNAAHVSMEQ